MSGSGAMTVRASVGRGGRGVQAGVWYRHAGAERMASGRSALQPCDKRRVADACCWVGTLWALPDGRGVWVAAVGDVA